MENSSSLKKTTLSHTLRTSLTVVVWSTERLKQLGGERLGEEETKLLDDILDEIKVMTKLVDTIPQLPPQ